jgi:cellulose synthase/poly-beta-1,6-N-acetylglucosamine synthase-like glycosyltransferase
VVWGFIWHRVERTVRLVPTLRLGESLAATDPPRGRVCVVVPAYNEARVIGGLVQSLRAETYLDLQVALVLDRCTDDTAALARAAIGGDSRFEIIEIDACPPDWVAKVHALHAGVESSRAAASADYLLFADADTLFAPGCIAAALALMRHRGLDLLSLLSTLTYDRWFERVAQTAASLELMRRFPLTKANGIGRFRAFANGQFMLFRRDAYEAIGGHEAVANSLFEDVALARRAADAGRRTGLFVADGLFHCRMYPDWTRFRSGWKRIYIQAADCDPSRLTEWSRQARWIGTILPGCMLAAGPLGALVALRDPERGTTVLVLFAVALATWLGALARIGAVVRAPMWAAPLHLAGAWLVANVFAEGARDVRSNKPTRWGGREYDVRAEQA